MILWVGLYPPYVYVDVLTLIVPQGVTLIENSIPAGVIKDELTLEQCMLSHFSHI